MDEALTTEAAEAASAKTRITKQHPRDTPRIGSPRTYLAHRRMALTQIQAAKNFPEAFRFVLNPSLKSPGGCLS